MYVEYLTNQLPVMRRAMRRMSAFIWICSFVFSLQSSIQLTKQLFFKRRMMRTDFAFIVFCSSVFFTHNS